MTTVNSYKDGVCVEFKRNYGLFSDEDSKSLYRKYKHTDNISKNKFFSGLPIEAKDYKDISVKRLYGHGFVQMVHTAFCQHIPIEFSADDIWLMIAQGLSSHEEVTGILGKIYDLPNPKKTIEADCPGFVRGQQNNWEIVFPQFESGMKKNIPETLYNLISNKKFSTTTKMNQICFTVCLMDSLKKYFSYRCNTKCGIPKFYLKGEKKDWEMLFKNTAELAREKKFGLVV